MALTRKELQVLKDACGDEKIVRFRYYPQKYRDGSTSTNASLQRYRYVIAFEIRKFKGKNLFFGYFYKGSSYSKKGDGYRLYYVKNMWDLTVSKIQNFRKFDSSDNKYIQTKGNILMYKNEIEQ